MAAAVGLKADTYAFTSLCAGKAIVIYHDQGGVPSKR